VYQDAPIDAEIEYESGGRGRYAVVVVTDYEAYADLDSSKKARLDDYCREYGVGLYFLYVGWGVSLNSGEVTTSSGGTLLDQRVDPESPVLRLTRDGGTLEGELPSVGCNFIAESAGGYHPVAYARLEQDQNERPNILADDGSFDGVHRIFHGHYFYRFWLHDLLFLDGLQWLSPVDLPILDRRWIGVDIDDIFQANYDPDPENRTVKIQAEDVEAMIQTQDDLSEIMEGDFRFVLGFNCGWYQEDFGPPPFDDAAGDLALVANRAEFRWFDHLPLHQDCTEYGTQELIAIMEESKAWAQANDVTTHITGYHLTPWHAGIDPVYEPLYEAWRQVWDTGYTSTTETVTGFEHAGVKVAPRQNSGILSSEYSFEQVDQDEIDSWIQGGFLSQRMIENPVNLFMTHQCNFARDRIGLYLFENLADFFDRWTHFQLVTGSNDELIEKYFELFPPEQ